jgi:hypothetical protein
MGGFGKMDQFSPSSAPAADCLRAINDYTFKFNKQDKNILDIGMAGQVMTKKCSGYMLKHAPDVIRYREETKLLYADYIQKFLDGDTEVNEWLARKSKEIVAMIAPVLTEITKSAEAQDDVNGIFSDKVWWGPIWFAANAETVVAMDPGTAYQFLDTISKEVFLEVIREGAKLAPAIPITSSANLRWIIMSEYGTTPMKFSKSSSTYFSCPFGICYSMEMIGSVGKDDISFVAEVETRSDGMIIWAWQDRSTYKNKAWWQLHCYKVSKDGVLSLIDTLDVGYDMTPVDHSAKSVGVASDDSYFIIRDYYLIDSVDGGIGFVETEVPIGDDMKELLNLSIVGHYANINEVTAPYTPLDASTSHYYNDGLLDRHWEKYDLDSDEVESWKGNGANYNTYTPGYSQLRPPEL